MIFLDSGAFVALWLAQDGKHALAGGAMKELRERRERLFTSNFVLDEALTLAARRAGGRFAAERGRNILDSKALTVLRPEADDERAALDLVEKFADQGVGFTDAVSFVLMRRHRIKRAFTFDGHFALAGFDVWPG